MAFAAFPEPPSIDAHRQLVQSALAGSLEFDAPTSEYLRSDLLPLYREAELVQVSILGGWDVEARRMVERMVRHVLRLASQTIWFLAYPEHRRVAIEETIVHNAYGWSVSSQDAQEAWLAVCNEERRDLEQRVRAIFDPASGALWDPAHADLPSVHTTHEPARQAEQIWLDAWDRWMRSEPF